MAVAILFPIAFKGKTLLCRSGSILELPGTEGGIGSQPTFKPTLFKAMLQGRADRSVCAGVHRSQWSYPTLKVGSFVNLEKV